MVRGFRQELAGADSNTSSKGGSSSMGWSHSLENASSVGGAKKKKAKREENPASASEDDEEEQRIYNKDWRARARSKYAPKGIKAKLKLELEELAVVGIATGPRASRSRAAAEKKISYRDKGTSSDESEHSIEEEKADVATSTEEDSKHGGSDGREDGGFGKRGRKKERIVTLQKPARTEPEKTASSPDPFLTESESADEQNQKNDQSPPQVECKRGRGRPKKKASQSQAQASSSDGEQVVETQRGRGRPRKALVCGDKSEASSEGEEVVQTRRGRGQPKNEEVVQTKRGRGRPRKAPVGGDKLEASSEGEEVVQTRRWRGQPRNDEVVETKRGRERPRKPPASGDESETSSEEEVIQTKCRRGQLKNQELESSSSGDDVKKNTRSRAGKAKVGEKDDAKPSRRRIKRVLNSDSDSGYGSEEGSKSQESSVEEVEDSSSDEVEGPRKKRVRSKAKKLGQDVLKLAEEGRKTDRLRKEMKSHAELEIGKVLVLKRPLKFLSGGEEGTEEIVIPEAICRHLQVHQRAGVEFMWKCSVLEQSGCILAHCMGLGKTLQAIVLQYAALLKNGKSNNGSIMVVAPVNTLSNWSKEFEKWCPENESSPEVYQLTDAGSINADRLGMLQEWQENGGILLIGYEQYRNLSMGRHLKIKKQKQAFYEALVEPGPSLVICDEGHVLRNSASGVSQALKRVKTLRRIVLSGTPLQNNLDEYHCMIDFVRPGLLGTAGTFKRDFVDPIYNGQCVDSTLQDVKIMKLRSHVLHGLLKGCVDRVDYKVLSSYLPPKYEYVIGIRLSKVQCDLYRKCLQRLMPGSIETGKAMVFKAYHSLAKIWTHPGILALDKERREAVYDSMDDFITTSSSEEEWVSKKKSKNNLGAKIKEEESKKSEELEEEGDDDSWWEVILGDMQDTLSEEHSGKILFLIKMLKETATSGDKILVFSQSLLLLDAIELVLEAAYDRKQGQNRSWRIGRDYFRLDGSSAVDKRQTNIDEFNSSKAKKARLFLISTRAGGMGVNLVAANRVILMDASWNPSHDKQAIFRAYRFGQTKPVYVYRLLAHGTMEQKIYGRQVTKQALASRVVDSEETGRHFTSQELADLFTFEPMELPEEIEAKQHPKKTGDLVCPIQAEDAPSVPDVTENGAIGTAKQGRSANKSEKMWEGVGLPPKDEMLATVMVDMLPKWIVGYHEADSLLEVEATLTPEEVEAAWAEFREHEDRLKDRQHKEAEAAMRAQQIRLQQQQNRTMQSNAEMSMAQHNAHAGINMAQHNATMGMAHYNAQWAAQQRQATEMPNLQALLQESRFRLSQLVHFEHQLKANNQPTEQNLQMQQRVREQIALYEAGKVEIQVLIPQQDLWKHGKFRVQVAGKHYDILVPAGAGPGSQVGF